MLQSNLGQGRFEAGVPSLRFSKGYEVAGRGEARKLVNRDAAQSRKWLGTQLGTIHNLALKI
jgi:hypothetical protein